MRIQHDSLSLFPAPKAPLVVSYGVGVDSTAMLVAMQQRGIRPDLILFADTRKVPTNLTKNGQVATPRFFNEFNDLAKSAPVHQISGANGQICSHAVHFFSAANEGGGHLWSLIATTGRLARAA